MSECIAFVGENLAKVNDKGKGICCLVFTVLITILVCISISIEGIEPTEWGLVKDNVAQEITDEVYEGGLQWVGLTNSIIRFPRIIQSIEFSDYNDTRDAPRLKTRTSEGLEIQLNCGFQFRLIKDELKNIYRMFEGDFKSKYVRIARSTLLSGVSEWEATDFWNKRTEVGDYLFEKLQKNFKIAGAEVVRFNLMKVDLPQAFNAAIIARQVMEQELTKFQQQRKVDEIKQETENIKAEAQKQVSKINGEANRDATELLEQARGQVAAQNVDGFSQQIKLIEDKLFPAPVDGNGDPVTESADALKARKESIKEFFNILKIYKLSEQTNNRLFVDVKKDDITVIN